MADGWTKVEDSFYRVVDRDDERHIEKAIYDAGTEEYTVCGEWTIDEFFMRP